MPLIDPSPRVNPCCCLDANLHELERRQATYPDGSDAGPLITYRCQVCERKHYVHEVKPFVVGVSGKGM